MRMHSPVHGHACSADELVAAISWGDSVEHPSKPEEHSTLVCMQPDLRPRSSPNLAFGRSMHIVGKAQVLNKEADMPKQLTRCEDVQGLPDKGVCCNGAQLKAK